MLWKNEVFRSEGKKILMETEHYETKQVNSKWREIKQWFLKQKSHQLSIALYLKVIHWNQQMNADI